MKKMLAILFATAAVAVSGIPGKAIAGPVIASSPDMVPNAFVVCGGRYVPRPTGCKTGSDVVPYPVYVKQMLGDKARLVGMEYLQDPSAQYVDSAHTSTILYVHIDK